MGKRKQKRNNSPILLLLLVIVVIALIFGYKKFIASNTTQNTVSESQKQEEPVVSSEAPEVSTSAEPTKTEKPSPVASLTPEEIAESKKKGLPVLMYHFFYDAQAGETGKDANYMEIHDFEEQVKYLADNGYYVPTWDEVLGYVKGENGLPLKSVVITVDDGDESFFRLASPVLEKYHIKATSFLITSWYTWTIDHTTFHPHIDLQSHSHNMHKSGSDGKGRIMTINHDEGVKDLETSRATINDTVTVFCYPFGHYNEHAKQIIKDANYTLAFTVEYGRVMPGQDPLVLPRIRMQKGDSLNTFIKKVE